MQGESPRRAPVASARRLAGTPVSHALRLSLCCVLQAPLVGSPAPDFTATAVSDQEFVETKLSSYKGKKCVL